MDQIFIKDQVVRGIIGVNIWEGETPQEMVINAMPGRTAGGQRASAGGKAWRTAIFQVGGG
jgi:dihydroneopterin aldolase